MGDTVYSKVGLFGVAVILYGILLMVESGMDFSLGGDILDDLCFMIGGLFVTVGGLYVVAREGKDKVDAIGVFAITFGIFKMFRALAGGGYLWLLPFVLAIPFIAMGVRFVKGTSISVVSNIFWSAVYIFIDLFYLFPDFNFANVVDIAILGMFIYLMMSDNVLENTPLTRDLMVAKVETTERLNADLNLTKAGFDAIGEGIKNGPNAALGRMRDSYDEHQDQLRAGVEKAQAVKRKKLVFNPKTKKYEEQK